ncbi:hypothetical protein, partial [Aquitalea sp. FJL05]|uniref:hypothetical protein n=1 Tax=Aquitalea sp. FJL05 TaxID=2153366 RepID=UPI001F4232CA
MSCSPGISLRFPAFSCLIPAMDFTGKAQLLSCCCFSSFPSFCPANSNKLPADLSNSFALH